MELATINKAPTLFQDKELNRATQKIFKLNGQVRKNLFEVGVILAGLEESKVYKSGGFSSVQEYATATFGYAKSMVYSLVSIGKEYTNRAEMCSNLPHGEDEPGYTTTQIERMLPLKSRDKVVELIQNNVINSNMSCREIAKAIEPYKPGKKSKKEDVKEEATEPVESTEQSEGEVPETEDPKERAMQEFDAALEYLFSVMSRDEAMSYIKGKVDNI